MKCFIKNKDTFDNIKNGIKMFEGRLYYGVWENVKIGDIIIFVHKENECTKIIKNIKLYNTIIDFCNEINLPEYINIFNSLYSQNLQEKYKVIILDI